MATPSEKTGSLRQREPREHDEKYLEWLRSKPCCCGCGKPPPSDAAHLRVGSLAYDKRPTGLAEKPHDRWAFPLNRRCHEAQHAFGSELVFWEQHGIDPFALCVRFYAEFGGTGGKPKTKRLRNSDYYTRPPPKKRQKIKSAKTIPSRPFPNKQRKLRSKKP